MDTHFMLERGDLNIHCVLTQYEAGSRVSRLLLCAHPLGDSWEHPAIAALTDEMALFDAAVFRFDFPGHGQSPLAGPELTVDSCVRALVEVAKEARARFPEVEDLCIFSVGFGGYVTLIALEQILELPGRTRLALQSPSVRMDLTVLEQCGVTRETLWAMDSYRIPWMKNLQITYRFYEELVANFVINTYPIPFLILQGEKDDVIRLADVRALRENNDSSRLVMVPDVGHDFTSEEACAVVADLGRDWLELGQVLLADYE